MYEHNLASGAEFSTQIRQKLQGIELRAEADYVEEEQEVERRFGAAVRRLSLCVPCDDD